MSVIIGKLGKLQNDFQSSTCSFIYWIESVSLSDIVNSSFLSMDLWHWEYNVNFGRWFQRNWWSRKGVGAHTSTEFYGQRVEWIEQAFGGERGTFHQNIYFLCFYS